MDEVKSKRDWMEEAFERGYQLGLAHGSKGSGMTWILADMAKPDDDTDIIIAVVPPKRRLRRKLAKHPDEYKPYVITAGHYFDEDSANEYFGRDGFRLPDLVVTGTKNLWMWDEILAWAYLNEPEYDKIKKGD